MGRATFGDPSVWSRLKGEEHSERSQSLTQVRGFPNSHPHESILKASPPQTPSDTTCCRELTKGGADRSPQLFCGSCDFHVLSSSQGIFSSSSFPLARSKNFLTTIQAFPKGRGEKKKITPPFSTPVSQEEKSWAGLLNWSWHTLPQTSNCCWFRGQGLGEERPSILGLTI